MQEEKTARHTVKRVTQTVLPSFPSRDLLTGNYCIGRLFSRS